MGQKQILVIAPHDDRELLKRCSTEKPTVHLPNERARRVLDQSSLTHEVIYVTKSNHDDVCIAAQEMAFAKDIIDLVTKHFDKNVHAVYLLVPGDFLETIVAHADAANVEPGTAGGTTFSRFVLILQEYMDEEYVDPDHVYAVIEEPIYPRYSRYSLDQRQTYVKDKTNHTPRLSVRDARKKSSEFYPAYDYALIASGDYSRLDMFTVEILDKLINQCLDKDRLDLASVVGAVLAKKVNKAS